MDEFLDNMGFVTGCFSGHCDWITAVAFKFLELQRAYESLSYNTIWQFKDETAALRMAVNGSDYTRRRSRSGSASDLKISGPARSSLRIVGMSKRYNHETLTGLRYTGRE